MLFRLRVFQGAVKLWETCILVFHNFMAPAVSTGLGTHQVDLLCIPPYPRFVTGTRWHIEICGHQRGGPILKVETPTLTERGA